MKEVMRSDLRLVDQHQRGIPEVYAALDKEGC